MIWIKSVNDDVVVTTPMSPPVVGTFTVVKRMMTNQST